MYVHTQGAGWSRNIWKSLTSGTVTFTDTQGKDKMTMTVEGGIATGVTRWVKGQKQSVEVFGQYKDTWLNGKRTRVLYRKGTTRHLAPAEYRTITITRHEPLYEGSRYKGTRTMKWTGWCLRSERFVYANGQVAYHRNRKQGELTVLSPTGKPLAHVADYQLGTPSRWRKGGANTHQTAQGAIADLLASLRTGQYRSDFTLWDSQGRKRAYGQYENGQRVGKWLTQGDGGDNANKGKRLITYYLRGVAVSQQVFETPPEQLDPNEVLKIDNAQLRAALLSRVGMQKVVEKCGGKVIDATEDGQSLLAIPIPERGSGDDMLHILKVVCPSTKTEYYLRTPPTLSTCREARLWTLGVETTRPEAAGLELVKET